MDEIEDRYLDKTKQYNDPLRMWADVHILLKKITELKEAVKKHKLGRREDARFRGISMEGIDYHAYKQDLELYEVLDELK